MHAAALVMQLLLIIVALATLPTASAGNINCKGSHRCTTLCTSETILFLRRIMDNAIADGKGDDYFQDYEHVACVTEAYNHKVMAIGGCCAFYQKGATGTLNDASRHLENLIAHKCEVCGSNSVDPRENVKNGEFTVNFVWDRGCDQGYCRPPAEREPSDGES